MSAFVSRLLALWERLGVARGALFGFALAVLMLWPGILYGPNALIGHPNLDVWSHAWGMSWFIERLASFELPWEVKVAAFPERRVLWYVDPLGALLTAPLQALSGPAVAWNVLLTLELTLCGWAAWLFGRALGGRGWLAAAALTTTPLLQTELWNGVSEACWLAPIPLAGALAARRSKYTGVAIGLAWLATPYHGFGATGLGAAILLMGGVGGERPPWATRLKELALALVIGAALALPQSIMLKMSVNTDAPFVNRPLWDGFNEPSMRTNAVDPRSLFMPGDFWSRETIDTPLSSPWKHTPYLGLGVLALAVVGFVRSPRLWPLFVVAVSAAVACLGFFLWWDGAWVRGENGELMKLPFGFFADWTKLGLVHHLRFVGVAVAILAAVADRGLGRLGVIAVPFVVYEHLQLAPNCWPLPVSPAQLPAVYSALPDDGRAVIDLPADSGYGNRTNRFLFYQALHDRPVPWTNKVGSMGAASMNHALRTWVLLSKKDPVSPGSPGVPPADADLGAAVDELYNQGFGWVVLHPRLLAEMAQLDTHKQSLDALLGPGELVEEVWVWEIPAPSTTP
ncbi:MAG: hypothetical protein IPO67_10020 [Deltaproteobacteria bacterium]|nr:hypothetical protein [Deltaproteobacteria bacterium]